jgi:hypothetical protein
LNRRRKGANYPSFDRINKSTRPFFWMMVQNSFGRIGRSPD